MYVRGRKEKEKKRGGGEWQQKHDVKRGWIMGLKGEGGKGIEKKGGKVRRRRGRNGNWKGMLERDER